MSNSNPFILEADALQAMLHSPTLRLVDASWYLPAQNRNGRSEYEAARIPGAVYFDIDAVSDRSSPLPHMLPTPDQFAKAMSALGISETDDIVVYDGPGMFSAARVWWTFRTMGAGSVRILDGGFDHWRADGRPIEEGPAKAPAAAMFKPTLDAARVTGIDAIRANLKLGQSLILDARPLARFRGEAPEPRAGLRSGHMPGARPLPATDLVRDGKLKPLNELQALLDSVFADHKRNIITSCGSGVTAAIISLALESTGHPSHTLYDGSWAEWGQADDAPVATWEDGEE
ncbi:MAG: 3-mercaptopyruvate sulfurtransferase [Rhizobiaceae bacterium]